MIYSKVLSTNATKRSLATGAMAMTICLLASGIAAAASLSQGGACQQIKDAVKASGSYVYHYRDPAHPSLPLYNVYVRSNSQCAADEAAVESPVPSLIDCDIPTCATQYDYGDR